MVGRTVDELEVGDTVEMSRVVRRQDIPDFVESVGDRNPIHSDPAFAATTPFREPIAPGVWTAGLISAAIGMHLPGPGSIHLSQDLRFLKPVRFGDTITVRVEVVELRPERNRVRLKTMCRNQRQEEVLSGEPGSRRRSRQSARGAGQRRVPWCGTSDRGSPGPRLFRPRSVGARGPQCGRSSRRSRVATRRAAVRSPEPHEPMTVGREASDGRSRRY